MRSTDWWQSLSSKDRHALARRLRYRDEVIVARFAEPDGDDEPVPSDFYEYLVGHEVYLDDGRKFHICTAHAEARAVLAGGRVHRDFECPKARRTCPLRRLLSVAPDRDCVLQLGARPKEPRHD